MSKKERFTTLSNDNRVWSNGQDANGFRSILGRLNSSSVADGPIAFESELESLNN